jgi:hypothetical protein
MRSISAGENQQQPDTGKREALYRRFCDRTEQRVRFPNTGNLRQPQASAGEFRRGPMQPLFEVRAPGYRQKKMLGVE